MSPTLWIVLGVVGLLIGLKIKSAHRSPEQLAAIRAAAKAGARLVDVRSPGEFAGGHIEGAINVPVTDLSGAMTRIGPTSKPVIVYCASGGRSAMAARVLRGQGYGEVYDLGPMGNWARLPG